MSAESRAALQALDQAPKAVIDVIDVIAINNDSGIVDLVADNEADRAIVAEHFGVTNDFGVHAPTKNWRQPAGLNVRVLQELA